MSLWVWALIALAVFLLFYILCGRAWLKEQAWSRPFFAWVEPIETALFQKSETMLTARLLSVGGFIVTGYDTFAVMFTGFDLTPITSRVLARVPEDMRGMVVSGAIALLGLLIAWLRKRTTKPLEVVAVPENAPPEVAAKVAKLEVATDNAVAAVRAA